MVVVFDCDCAAIPESEVPVFASRYAALMFLSFAKVSFGIYFGSSF